MTARIDPRDLDPTMSISEIDLRPAVRPATPPA
jgi:hypothetical protein